MQALLTTAPTKGLRPQRPLVHALWAKPACSRRPGRSLVRVAAKRQAGAKAAAKALAVQWTLAATQDTPFFEPFVRTFILGVSAGALLEGSHVAAQVLAGSFPGVSHYSPLLMADHVTAFTSWLCLYAVEAAAIVAVLKRFNWDTSAANSDIQHLTTLPKRMLPLRLRLFDRFFNKRGAAAAATAQVGAPAERGATAALTASTTSAMGSVTRAPGMGSVTPLPRKLRPDLPPGDTQRDSQYKKRAKELRDRSGYLKNVWYAAALSDKVKDEPVKVLLCGKEMVIWRDQETGAIRCIDNACPHRGAPLSEGWVETKESHSCVVCPYHGWALDGKGAVHDVPAAENKGEWPKRPLVDSYPVEEKGGFIWLFFGSSTLPAEERPPIPYVPELDDPSWKPVYEEMEFECGHHSIFENSFDFAHIHYLHGDSFGNEGKPEIKDLQTSHDAYSVNATFKIHNKPPNAFWAAFKVPIVEVTAKAFLPSSSFVTFTLGNGLSFTTFVNTVPISANRSINRFALVRKLSWDKTGVFNAKLWDGMARDAMKKILSQDKVMVEQLRYEQLPAEYSVRADLPQVEFRKLRQRWADLVGVIPTEVERPPYTVTNRDM